MRLIRTFLWACLCVKVGGLHCSNLVLTAPLRISWARLVDITIFINVQLKLIKIDNELERDGIFILHRHRAVLAEREYPLARQHRDTLTLCSGTLCVFFSLRSV